MRLLHTQTFKPSEFFDKPVPKYAIVSHRWRGKELSLPETANYGIELGSSDSSKKIKKFCQIARSRGFDWLWIDTCCIDRTSSVELGESINSMFNYYKRASECYAYLHDVEPIRQNRAFATTGNNSSYAAYQVEQMRNSSWFTRGWTLQELLAPPGVLFFNKDFELIESRTRASNVIAGITGIDAIHFKVVNNVHTLSLHKASIAQRFSWISKRQTTKEEDMAYCLLGVFNINMPIIYGEGRRAFIRLQAEIIKHFDDDSIFAWSSPLRHTGLLAQWPDVFVQSGGVVRASRTPSVAQRRYTLTARGLEFQIRLRRSLSVHWSNFWRTWPGSERSNMASRLHLYLNCVDQCAESRRLVVTLSPGGGGSYYRTSCSSQRQVLDNHPKFWSALRYLPTASNTVVVAQPGWQSSLPAFSVSASATERNSGLSAWQNHVSALMTSLLFSPVGVVLALLIVQWIVLTNLGLPFMSRESRGLGAHLTMVVEDFLLWVSWMFLWQFINPSKLFERRPADPAVPWPAEPR